MQIWDVVVMKIDEVLESVLAPLCLQTYQETHGDHYIERITDICLKVSEYIRNLRHLPYGDDDLRKEIDTRIWLKVIAQRPAYFRLYQTREDELLQLIKELTEDFNRLAHRNSHRHFNRSTSTQTAERAIMLIHMLGLQDTGADEAIQRIIDDPNLLYIELKLNKMAAKDLEDREALPLLKNEDDSDEETAFINPFNNKIYIEITTSASQIKPFIPGEKTFLIGRGTNNHLIINDLLISKRHVGVTFKPDTGLMLVDLESTNGSLLNGYKMRPAVLYRWNIGDQVKIGQTTLISKLGA